MYECAVSERRVFAKELWDARVLARVDRKRVRNIPWRFSEEGHALARSDLKMPIREAYCIHLIIVVP